MTGQLTIPPHGRSIVPDGCLCDWVRRVCDLDGPVWWQMRMRVRECPRHRWLSDPYVYGQTNSPERQEA